MNKNDKIVFDSMSARHKDENGFLHVDKCHITKEQVVPYYGREIPGWRELGLESEKLYNVYRPAEELEKGFKTFNGLPLLLEHHPESAENPQKLHRVGSLGDSAEWNPPYIDVSLHVTDQAAIDAIEQGRFKELSAAYQYEPVLQRGEFNGMPYDIVMKNIRGNHVALVREGRAGPDVVVADAKPKKNDWSFAEWYKRKLAQDAARTGGFMAWAKSRGIIGKKKLQILLTACDEKFTAWYNKVVNDSNSDDDVQWITTKTGVHIPIQEGQKKKEAVKEAFAPKGNGKKSSTSQSTGEKSTVTAMKQRIAKTFSKVRSAAHSERLSNAFAHSPEDFTKALEKNCKKVTVKTVDGSGAAVIDGVFNIGRDCEAEDNAYEGVKRWGDISGHGGVVRHEIGHALDYQLAQKMGMDDEFMSSHDPEFKSAVLAARQSLYEPDPDNPGEKRFKQKYLDWMGEGKNAQSGEFKKYADCIPVSDIFSALTGGKLEGERGHLASYWKKGIWARNTEIFAELTNLYAAEDRSVYQAMKKEFPALTDAYEKMIKKAGE